MEVGQAPGTGRSENGGEEAKKGNGHESAKDRKKIATPNPISTGLRDSPRSGQFRLRGAPTDLQPCVPGLVIQGEFDCRSSNP